MRIKRALPLLAVAAGMTVAACGQEEEKRSDQGAQKSAPPKVGVQFVSPGPDATTSEKVNARVALTNFKVDAQNVGRANEQGAGHLHFSLDGGKYDFPKYSGENGKIAKSLGVDGKYSPSVTPTITYRGIPAGEHTLRVELANNDHSDTGNATEVKFRTQ